MQKPGQNLDFALKETSSKIGAGAATGDKLTCTYDLVEQMHYLYIRVVKRKELQGKDVTYSCDPYVEVKLGNYRGTTKHFEKNSNPEWRQVFAFSKERIQASILEVTVKNKDAIMLDDFIRGIMLYDRLRSIGGRVQTVIGDLATQGERFSSLLSWRDPRATTLFLFFCLVAAVVLYVTPFQVVALLTGIYALRHPRFRHNSLCRSISSGGYLQDLTVYYRHHMIYICFINLMLD
ncbi:hypothetical protein Bca4012_016409 [Brassica carinata]